jgi:hypothetical protein
MGEIGGGREGDFWPYYAPNPLRGRATKGCENMSLSRAERERLEKVS